MSYKNINKPTARKMYNKGYRVYLLPCKVSGSVLTASPDFSWIEPVEISLIDSKHEANHFDRSVNEYEYYNCNALFGYYAHYYVLRKDYDKYKEELKCQFIRV